MFEILGYVLEGLCFLTCALHVFFNHRSSKRLSLKVDEVCNLCGEKHSSDSSCFLNDKQVLLLSQFIESLLEEKNK